MNCQRTGSNQAIEARLAMNEKSTEELQAIIAERVPGSRKLLHDAKARSAAKSVLEMKLRSIHDEALSEDRVRDAAKPRCAICGSQMSATADWRFCSPACEDASICQERAKLLDARAALLIDESAKLREMLERPSLAEHHKRALARQLRANQNELIDLDGQRSNMQNRRVFAYRISTPSEGLTHILWSALDGKGYTGTQPEREADADVAFYVRATPEMLHYAEERTGVRAKHTILDRGSI